MGDKKVFSILKGVYSRKQYMRKEERFRKYKRISKFEGRMSVEVRRQEEIEERWKIKLNPKADEFKKSELPGKYTAKMLFGWNDRKFKDEYLKKLERC